MITMIHLHTDSKDRRASFWHTTNGIDDVVHTERFELPLTTRVKTFRNLSEQRYMALEEWCARYAIDTIDFSRPSLFTAKNYIFGDK